MRNEFLQDRLSNLLERLSPPQAIKGKPEAMRDEMQVLFSAVNHAAPTSGYEGWWQEFEGHLLGRMQTRAWPIVFEIKRAAGEIRGRSREEVSRDTEPMIVEMMARWHEKFRDQMPSMGRPSRTEALIEMGAIRDWAEARECGYDMTDDQRRTAIEQAGASQRAGYLPKRAG